MFERCAGVDKKKGGEGEAKKQQAKQT